MCVDIREAFKERSYVLVLIVFSMLDGAFVSFASVLSVLFGFYTVNGQPVYGTGVIAIYGASTAIFGVIASLVMSIRMQKTH